MDMDDADEGREDVDTSFSKPPLLTSDMSLEILELFDSMASERNGFYSSKNVSIDEPLNRLISQECEPNGDENLIETNTDKDNDVDEVLSEDNKQSQEDITAEKICVNKSTDITKSIKDLNLKDDIDPANLCKQTSSNQDSKDNMGLLNGHNFNESISSMETTLPDDSSMDLNTSNGSMDSDLTEVNTTTYSPIKLVETVLEIVEEPILTKDSSTTEESLFKRSGNQDSVNNNSNNLYNSNHDTLSGRDSTDYDSTQGSTRNSADFDAIRNSTDFDDDDEDTDGACSSRSRNSGFIEYKVQEILETERSYVKDLDDIVEGYLLAILDRPTLPLKPEDYQALFSNLESIRDFNKEFLKDLEDCDCDPVLIADCFLEKEEEFIMYSQYCTNYPSAVKVLTKCLRDPVMYNFFQEAQNKLGHPLPLGAYLLKPVQRILKYHLLFHDICKHVSHDDDIFDTLEEALDAMKEVAKQINHMKAQSDMVMRVQQIQSQLLDHRDLSSYGELLLEDVMRLQGSRGDRTVYLFEKAFFIAKRREDGYIAIKTEIKCTNLLLMENIAKESFGFIVMPFDNRDEQHILVAKTLEQKQQWTHQIKKMILENFSGLIPSKAKDIVLNSQSGSFDYASTDEQPIKYRKRKPRSKHRRKRRYSDPPSQLRRGNIQVKESPTEANQPPTVMGMKKPDVAKLMTGKRASSLVRGEGVCSTEESMSESESSNSPNRLSTVQINDKDETTGPLQTESEIQSICITTEHTDDNAMEQNHQKPIEQETNDEICPDAITNTDEQSRDDPGEDSPDELDILETLHDTAEIAIQEEDEEPATTKEDTSPFKLRSNIKELKPKKPEELILDNQDVWIKRPLIRGLRISGIRPLNRPLSADIFMDNKTITKQPLSRSVSSGLQVMSDPNILSTKMKSEPALNKAGVRTPSESISSMDQSFSSHESILDSFQDIVAEQEKELSKEPNLNVSYDTWKNSKGEEVVKKKQEPLQDNKVSMPNDSEKSTHKSFSAEFSAIGMRASKVFKMARDYSQRVKRTSRPALANIVSLDKGELHSKPKNPNVSNNSSNVAVNKLLPASVVEEEAHLSEDVGSSALETKGVEEQKKIVIYSEKLKDSNQSERNSRDLQRRFAVRKSKSAEGIKRFSLPKNSEDFEDPFDEPVGNFTRGPSIKDRMRSIKEKTTYQKKPEIKDLPPKFKSLKERQKELEKCVAKPIPKTNVEVEKLIPADVQEEDGVDESDSKATKLTRHNSCSSVSSIKLSSPIEPKHRRWSSRSSGLDEDDGIVFRSVKQRQQLLQKAYSKPVPKTVDVKAEISKSSRKFSDR